MPWSKFQQVRDEIHQLLGEWRREPEGPMKDITAVIADRIIWKLLDAGMRMSAKEVPTMKIWKDKCNPLCEELGITLDRAKDVLNHNPDKIEWDTIFYWLHRVVNHTDKKYGVAEPKAWLKRWRLLYDEEFVKLCIEHLGFWRQDHTRASDMFIEGIHKESDLYRFLTMQKVYYAAEQWALAVRAGEEVKRNLTQEDRTRILKEMEEAMP